MPSLTGPVSGQHTTDDRRLSHLARVCDHVMRRTRSRREPGRGVVHRVGRAKLANLLNRSQRTVSRATHELERAGRVRKIPPRRQPVDGGWICVEVQGYVIMREDKTAGRTDVTRMSPHPLRGSGVATKRRPRDASQHAPRGVAPPEVFDWSAPVETTAPTVGYLAARAALRGNR